MFVIFQNYYTPARHALFSGLHARGINFTVLYMQQPTEEGRAWREPSVVPYPTLVLPHMTVAKNVLFWVPQRFWHGTILMLDNNPSNICAIVWTLLFWLLRVRRALWVEHIPDRYKGRAKLAFQKTCSRILCLCCPDRIAFSTMSERYLNDLGVTQNVHRMLQATPSPRFPCVTRLPGSLTVFGYLGSADRRKNVQPLVAGFQSLSDPRLRLRIAGFVGSATDPRVEFLGYVDDDARETFFRSIDVLVLPSLADPWGFVVNEALERGCLAIVSSRCGCTEIVNEISPSLVCDVSQEALSACLRAAAELPPQSVQTLRRRAADTIVRYSMDNAIERFSAIVTSLIAGNRKAA